MLLVGSWLGVVNCRVLVVGYWLWLLIIGCCVGCWLLVKVAVVVVVVTVVISVVVDDDADDADTV